MKKKNILMISCLCILTCLLAIGVSYAYWRLNYAQEKKNVAGSQCFHLDFANQQNEIQLSNIYPISDEEGKKLVPFSFTITNTCDMLAAYSVNMEMLSNTTMNSNYMAVMVNREEIKLLSDYETTSTVIEDSLESRVLANGILKYNESVNYSVSVWMDKSVTTTDAMNQTFASKIIIVGEPAGFTPVLAGYTKLKDAILANEYQTTPERAIEKINAKQEVNLANSAPVIKWIETTGGSATISPVKPAPSSIGIDNQTSNLTTNDTLLKLYMAKTFDSESGRYTLSNYVYVDPTTLDYNTETNGGIKYYFSDEFIIYHTSGILETASGNNAPTVYQVTGATKDNSTTNWNGTNYASITYHINTTILTEIELESDESDKGLYAGTDRDGTTYYYRGNIKNNNVLFAGFYWQIIRINGDGSIRLMYNGITPNATGDAQMIGYSSFNLQHTDPAYVGYMYGNTIGTRENNIKNEVNSAIKDSLDSWYRTNILDRGYSGYIADNGFCNDRSLYSGDGVQLNVDTQFGAVGRSENNTATYMCPNEASDLFTLTTSSYGNKALTYPVGLITYDELVFAGIDYSHLNKLSWAYSSQYYWTMSPSYFYSPWGLTYGWYQDVIGYLVPWNPVSYTYGVRPVISLNADVEITEGLGTADNPFLVKTN